MNLNIQDVLNEKFTISIKPSYITSFNISIEPTNISEYSTLYNKLAINALLTQLDKMKYALKAISTNDKLNSVKKIINSDNLNSIEIVGYNYTHLHNSINIKNALIKHYEMFMEIYSKMVDIIESDDSEISKINRLNDLYGFTNKIVKEYDKYFSLLDYGFPNNTEFPDYYNDGNSQVTLSYNSKDYAKVYEELKQCYNQYNALITAYQRDISKYYNMIDKVLVNSTAPNKTFLGINDDNSELKGKINNVNGAELHISKTMVQQLISIISFQMNAILDSLKQDIAVINKLFDTYKLK